MSAIEINPNESGETRFYGGWRCGVLPAGYIGSTIAGAILLFAGFGIKTSKYISIAVDLILVATVYWANSITTVIITVVLIAMMLGVYIYQDGIYQKYFILFMGAIGCLVSILNITSTTVFNTIDKSDAVEFAKHCSILIPAFVYGILWCLISLVIIIASISAALIVFK